jgi:hypothetical protein
VPNIFEINAVVYITLHAAGQMRGSEEKNVFYLDALEVSGVQTLMENLFPVCIVIDLTTAAITYTFCGFAPEGCVCLRLPCPRITAVVLTDSDTFRPVTPVVVQGDQTVILWLAFPHSHAVLAGKRMQSLCMTASWPSPG